MRRILAVALTLVSLAAGAAGSAATGSGTSLTITYWERGLGHSEPWTLRCNPARGTLERPAVACRRLAAATRAIFAPTPRGVFCTEIYRGPQAARIVGLFQGTRVYTTFTRTNGCEIARWNRLSPWLLPAAPPTR